MGIMEDLAAALRQFRQRPGFALLVMLTLGSAMGISTALFSIADVSWSREWPVPEADRIVTTRVPMSLEEARYWSQHSRLFEGLAASQVGFSNHRFEGRRVFFDFVTTNYGKKLEMFDVCEIF